MSEHRIHLRGGWECAGLDRPASESRRVTLPAPTDTLPPGRVVLIRWFQRPPRAANERARLIFENCAGVLSLVYNGKRLEPVAPGTSNGTHDLGVLEPRNELRIEAEPPRGIADWGRFALLFAGEPEDLAPNGQTPE